MRRAALRLRVPVFDCLQVRGVSGPSYSTHNNTAVKILNTVTPTYIVVNSYIQAFDNKRKILQEKKPKPHTSITNHREKPKSKGLCIYYVIVFGASERPPPYVIDCDKLVRPPTPSKTQQTVEICQQIKKLNF